MLISDSDPSTWFAQDSSKKRLKTRSGFRRIKIVQAGSAVKNNPKTQDFKAPQMCQRPTTSYVGYRDRLPSRGGRTRQKIKNINLNPQANPTRKIF